MPDKSDLHNLAASLIGYFRPPESMPINRYSPGPRARIEPEYSGGRVTRVKGRALERAFGIAKLRTCLRAQNTFEPD
jgi:hypothetical protein